MLDEKLTDLVKLAAKLRGPNGCPWDREQNYDSAKALLLEEAYEVIDAVNSRDFEGLREELGDLLFQVVFYSQMASEEGRFSISEVIDEIHQKLVRRHPHVFGDIRANNPEEALKSWLSVKKKEKQEEKRDGDNEAPLKSILDGISSGLPSTLEAHELGTRVSEVGFEWKTVGDLLDKISEELIEIRGALHQNNSPLKDSGKKTPSAESMAQDYDVQEEIGDLLFTTANLARFLQHDSETTLRAANQKFKLRFKLLEAEVVRKNKTLQDCSPEELENIWSLVKSKEKR